ncbi:NADH:ubiquinone oxidoreductase 13.4kD subunit [Ascodesmis nigricans]|uniref:NADH dehydrogenase [ubiquinone] 1 alpha subcomplex subunit n=1 Tax=Ascodesmis nigricans TaxID=341454 RepID=A0A4S2N257_9PEZI|nr:NADH:ubiquinone oxidoreductase 13.4kD subunit [Ascodesmis nigricans]
MSTPIRTIRNLYRVGFKSYFNQMLGIGDTKAGTLIGTDRFGNKYFENNAEELPLRTKWVEYREYDYDASHVEPGWHAWLHYLTDKPANVEPNMLHEVRPWEKPEPPINQTFTRAAYKPYSTTIPKIQSWEPVARARA